MGITIYIRRLKVETRLEGDHLIQVRSTTKNEYTETRSTMGIGSMTGLANTRHEFLEETTKKITSENKREEARARRNRGGIMEKLLIFNIKN